MPSPDIEALKRHATLFNGLPEKEALALIDELEQLRADNQATDGTDAAHPSYWRGCSATFAAMSEQLRKILDGEDDCSGVCQEPWDSLRRRVLDLRQQLATAKAVGAAEICADADKYYVYSQQDAKAGYAGGSIVWWRGGGHGYARDLKGAGVFTIEDYLQGYPNPNHCVYVPCNRVVDAAFKSETLVWAKHLPKARQLAKEIETRAAELRKQDPK
jgi:hypothetical protein